MTRFVVSGTDTGIGKTVFSAALAGALNARYWKPIQSGLVGETDSETVVRLSGLPAHRIMPEAYRLTTPASPHLSARIDSVKIDHWKLQPPEFAGPLVIEGAGGLLVPLDQNTLFADIFARWGLPVILCARTALGTINHTLLSIEALRKRGIPLLGVAFIGLENADTQATIGTIGRANILGRLPFIEHLTSDSLRQVFEENFDVASWTEGGR